MCGICGYLDIGSRKTSEKTLEDMCTALTHRGPDDAGTFTQGNVGLGHRRLSIIDLSQHGHQPMTNEDGTIWLVFNGEIYNFPEIRDDLVARGHSFKSKCDAEVILHLYEDMGRDCLSKLNGMFAFCIWDMNRKEFFLVRDRMGVKPLYYTRTANSFIFSSELKAILKHPDVIKELDMDALDQYVSLEYVPAPRTIFKNIKKLDPASYLVVSQEGPEKKVKYWEVCYNDNGDSRADDEYYIKNTESLLKEAVGRRLISDVPLGAFLSGGIDSSLVVALISSMTGSKLKTFNVAFEEQSFDESQYAKKVSNIFSTEHHEYVLSSRKALGMIPKMAEYIDEPFGDASFVPTLLLSESTKKFVTVALSGDGGDEVFAGYPTYQAHKLAPIYQKIPGFLREQAIPGFVNNMPVSMNNFSLDFKLKKFISGMNYPAHIRHLIWMGSFGPKEKEHLYSSDIKGEMSSKAAFKDMEKYWDECKSEDIIERLLNLDRRFYLQEDCLVKVDRTSMQYSLEVRSPFLDYELIEFVAGIPDRLKLKGITTKYILKEIAKEFLPADIVKRPKKGFGIPVAHWIRNELKDFILGVFDDTKIKKEGIFNPEYIKQILKQHLEGTKDNRKLLYTLLSFELWYEKYM